MNTRLRWHHKKVLKGAKGIARGMDGGKFKRKLSEVNTRAVSIRQNKLVGKFKMAAGDMISIRGQFMEYMYIPTGVAPFVTL